MSGWKQKFSAPAGALPKGILNKAGIALAAGLLLVVIFASGGSEEEEDSPAGGESAEAPAQTSPGVVTQAGAAIERLAADAVRAQQDEQRRRQAEARALEQRERDRAVARDPALAGLSYAAAPGEQAPAETAEGQLLEELRLLEIRRRHESLRADPVAHSTRETAPDGAEPTGPAERSAAPAETADAYAAKRAAASGYSPAELAELEAIAASGGVAEPADAAPTPTTRPEDPPGWERIFEGQILEAVLTTQIRGDLAGPAAAIVSSPLWSRDRQRVLVPRGARTIGRSEAVTGWGQARLAVAFHRLIFPDSTYVRLRFEGLSQAGETGLRDRVNRHYLSTFGAAGAVGAIAGLTLRGSNPYAGGIEGARAGTGAGLGQGSERILDRYLNRLPTITVRAGHRIRIVFTSDVLVPRRGPPNATDARRQQP